MKVILPEHIGEITLGQFQRYTALMERENVNEDKLNKLKIEIFTGIPFRNIDDLLKKDKDDILKQIDVALQLTPEFKNRFELQGIEFGLIPNFDKIRGSEFADLQMYQNKPEQLHRLMAILFRPVTKTDKFKNYKIQGYNGTSEYCDLMKQMPLVYVNGALSFFLNLSNELEVNIQTYTMEVQVKEARL